MSAPYTLSPMELGYAEGTPLVATEANASTADGVTRYIRLEGNGGGGLHLAANDMFDFALWNVAAVDAASGWALLGEVRHKWVGVSPARVTAIATGAGPHGSMAATVRGAPNESIELAFAPPASATHDGPLVAKVVKCVLPATGVATLRVLEATCE